MATIEATADESRERRRQDRIVRLRAEDPEFRDAVSSPDVVARKTAPGLRLAEVVREVMEGYADRPALGQRARELVADPATGRRTLRLLPRFETITYRDLWARARAIATAWHHDARGPFAAGEALCVLGFTSPDYAALLLAGIHRGAVNVPLQTSAPASQHAAIIAETEPKILAASIEYLDAAVEALLAGFAPRQLVVFDYDARDDDHRDGLARARARLSGAQYAVTVDTLDDLVEHAASQAEPPLYVAAPDEDPLAWLFYTSGSTGTPKGAMFPQSLVITSWLSDNEMPSITLSFMPMSHLVGNGYLTLALANGGTSYCAPKSDLSTLFEDLSLARPTMTSLVPRVCELLHHHFLADVDRRVSAGEEQAAAEDAAKREMRETLLGGRLLSVGCGSASLAQDTYAFMESMLDLHVAIGYSATEIGGGTVLLDWKITRPPVIDYKLVDVPELGYFSTDKPYPRGELLVKTDRFMAGYYKRPDLTAEKRGPDGFYRTGDVMAEIGPDHLVFVDRCNNVIKLSQGEFVAVSRLEALYAHSPAIRQIYLYGNSERAFLLGVVVPDEDLVAASSGDALGGDAPSGDERTEAVKSALRRAMQDIAEENALNGYEVPRDFIIETTPFSLQNGLLSEIGKHQRPKLKDHYGERLEAMYHKIAQDQLDVLRSLRTGGGDAPVIESVMRAVQASLGLDSADLRPGSRFIDLGGDSLAALTFSTLLEEIFAVEVPVGVIINPAGDLQLLADYIEAARNPSAKRPTYATTHDPESTEVHAHELTLDKFIDVTVLARAPTLPLPTGPIQSVLMTGTTGFLGRFQALAWLERLARTGGKLFLLARGASAAEARQRMEAALESDTELLAHFRTLAAGHLEVLPGDLGLPGLGLDEATWLRLAETVDLIVHTGAHVNHVLPYNQLFAANVAGTAELIRLALTSKLKRFHYLSTLGVSLLAGGAVDEDGDIRRLAPSGTLNDESYALGYNVSKWASEVLMREAFDLCHLPVSVFRPGMILAHSRYVGQLNVPDMFTRLLLSLATTGIAPGSFYAKDLTNGRPKARYDGLPVDFLAEVITAIGAQDAPGFNTYNLSTPHEDPVSLDDFVDWMTEEGCRIERIDRYDEWFGRFETTMRSLPEQQRQASLLNIHEPYRQPQAISLKSSLPAARFHAAAAAAGQDFPRMSASLIKKYVRDLRHFGML